MKTIPVLRSRYRGANSIEGAKLNWPFFLPDAEGRVVSEILFYITNDKTKEANSHIYI